MTRRDFAMSALGLAASAALPSAAATRRWPLGYNTYCLRFLRWNDRRHFDFAIEQKLDSVFLQDSADPGVMDPKHWVEVRAWAKDAGGACQQL